jgi:hypothetical protein
MRKVWIALAVCAAGFLAWGTVKPTHAAMMIGGNQADMSMVEQVKAKKKAKAAPAQCNDYLIVKCCTVKGKETCNLPM